jgi:hypothetical protein
MKPTRAAISAMVPQRFMGILSVMYLTCTGHGTIRESQQAVHVWMASTAAPSC